VSLSIASRSLGDITVVACTGRIVDGDETTSLESHVKKLLPMQPYIVLHLGGITVVDSCGLGLLLRLRTLARTAGGDLKLCAANHHVREVLRVTKLDGVLATYESEPDAITAFYAPDKADDPWASPKVDVLCVHPSLDVLAYVREVLKQSGYGVATASNVSDARVLLRATTPRVMVIDSDWQARLATLIGEDPATQLALVPWPADFSTQNPGDAAQQLLAEVKRGGDPSSRIYR
jgi:anti-anti-sigma factor